MCIALASVQCHGQAAAQLHGKISCPLQQKPSCSSWMHGKNALADDAAHTSSAVYPLAAEQDQQQRPAARACVLLKSAAVQLYTAKPGCRLVFFGCRVAIIQKERGGGSSCYWYVVIRFLLRFLHISSVPSNRLEGHLSKTKTREGFQACIQWEGYHPFIPAGVLSARRPSTRPSVRRPPLTFPLQCL